ncbi:hypothetical protein GCM10022221_76770 [Actinocorallia aurea]
MTESPLIRCPAYDARVRPLTGALRSCHEPHAGSAGDEARPRGKDTVPQSSDVGPPAHVSSQGFGDSLSGAAQAYQSLVAI